MGEGMMVEDVPVSNGQPIAAESIEQRMMTIREDLQSNILTDSLKKYHVEGKYVNLPDFSFFENILNIFERNTKTLSEFKAVQEKVGSKVEGYLKSTKLSR